MQMAHMTPLKTPTQKECLKKPNEKYGDKEQNTYLSLETPVQKGNLKKPPSQKYGNRKQNTYLNIWFIYITYAPSPCSGKEDRWDKCPRILWLWWMMRKKGRREECRCSSKWTYLVMFHIPTLMHVMFNIQRACGCESHALAPVTR